MIELGLDAVLGHRADLLQGSRIGLIANPASVNARLEHAADLFRQNPAFKLSALFGPQHGIRGQTQDNMIEWQSFRDERSGLPSYSLYGETRKPTSEMLKMIDVLVIDLQDVGTRVYTFVYTMALAMEAAAEYGKRVVVLDRPNPIAGDRVEGNLHSGERPSFVGMFPIPMRHGMTIGELALMFNQHFGIGCDLQVVPMTSWRRSMWFEETGLKWVMPSPNMPTTETATVYPGSVMVEGTNLSEGRGTTRPFEIIGAPYVDSIDLVLELNKESLPGVIFRPLYFQPTFNKFAGDLCGGVQIHCIDRNAFMPAMTGVAIIKAARQLYPDKFAWKQPPYEYVHDLLPIDVITGDSQLREQIDSGESLSKIEESWRKGLENFMQQRERYLLYSD